MQSRRAVLECAEIAVVEVNVGQRQNLRVPVVVRQPALVIVAAVCRHGVLRDNLVRRRWTGTCGGARRRAVLLSALGQTPGYLTVVCINIIIIIMFVYWRLSNATNTQQWHNTIAEL